MVVAGVRDLKFLEDRSHVRLDSPFGDDQACCHRRVRATLCDQLEHLQLTSRQRPQPLIAAARRNQRSDDRGVERRAAGRHAFNRVDEFVDASDAVLQQVAECAGADELDGMPRLDVL